MLRVETEFLKDLDVFQDNDTSSWDWESDQHEGYQYCAIPLYDIHDVQVGSLVTKTINNDTDEYISINELYAIQLDKLNIPYIRY